MPKLNTEPKTARTFRLNDLTIAQIEKYAQKWNATQADVIATAMDRLDQRESTMNYKGWTIETFATIGGYGWSATSEDYGAMGKPNASQNDHTTYTTEEAAQSAAKTAITQFLNAYHYEGEAKF